MVRRRLGALVRSRFETADLAQEAMVDALEAATGCNFESEGAFLRWVEAVVERRILQTARYCRAAQRSPLREVPLEPVDLPADAKLGRPSEVIERRETVDRLSEAIGALPPDDRQVVVARLFLELPWSQVASLARTSEPAAQMRFVRARRRLEKLLAGA